MFPVASLSVSALLILLCLVGWYTVVYPPPGIVYHTAASRSWVYLLMNTFRKEIVIHISCCLYMPIGLRYHCYFSQYTVIQCHLYSMI